MKQVRDVKRTVFIVGAGASAEVNMPIGRELCDRIGSVLALSNDEYPGRWSGDQSIIDAIRFHAGMNAPGIALQPYFNAARLISAAMPLAASIDNFIDQHRRNTCVGLCGKLAIARTILQAEKDSLMATNMRQNGRMAHDGGIGSTWYPLLWRALTKDCESEDLAGRFASAVFVVFNYDRCLEHYLYEALQVYYDLPPNAAAALIKELRIYHPYGTVGALPWLPRPDQVTVEFGSDAAAPVLLAQARGIRTFTQVADPKADEIENIRRSVAEADRLIFLGFAFDPMNLALLWPHGPASETSDAACYATAYKISDENVLAIRGDLMNLMGVQQTHLYVRNEYKCSQLLERYGRSLSFVPPS